MLVRLNKYLSGAGVASRRQADQMIVEGKVRVNGVIVQELGFKVDGGRDRVEVEGKKVEADRNLVYLMLNKPPGYLVTLKDPFSRPTVFNLLPPLGKRIFPVGRLDLGSEGLLLLTNDGDLAQRLTHPRYEVKKVYLVKVKGKLDEQSLARLEKGIFLEGKKTAPARSRKISTSPRQTLLKLEIHEGRKREVRRMLEAVGHRVLGLKRIEFAGLRLSNLKLGQWRHLTKSEVARLRSLGRRRSSGIRKSPGPGEKLGN